MLDNEERILIKQGRAPLEQDKLRIDVSEVEEEEEEEDREVSDVDSIISRQSHVYRTAIIENHDFVRI